MRHSLLVKVITGFMVGTIIVLLAGYAHIKYDPYEAYRSAEKKPLKIEPQKLNYFAEAEQLIRKKLDLKNLSQRERTILAGIHWLITFADNEENFDFMFADFMLLINVLKSSENRIHQHEVADLVLKTSIIRAGKKLDKLFGTDEESRWSLIGLFHILADYPEIHHDYFQFYQKNFGSPVDDGIEEFRKAIRLSRYKTLFGYLVHSSFLHYYVIKVKDPKLKLPPDKFPQYLAEFKNFNYLDHSLDSSQFRDLGYLATHIPLVLTNYGQLPIKEGILKDKVQKYLISTLDKAYRLGDFDLLAEYVQCIKMMNPNSRSKRIKNLEKFIMSLQHANGSWGSERDFTTTPYTAIHPGGAALMALNQSNEPVPIAP